MIIFVDLFLNKISKIYLEGVKLDDWFSLIMKPLQILLFVLDYWITKSYTYNSLFII